MQNNKLTNRKTMKRICAKLLLVLMVVSMLTQSMALTASALMGEASSFLGGDTDKGAGSVSGIGKFESEEVIQQLKKQFLSSLNQNLVKRIDDYKLSGEVGVIITFSDDSLIERYNSSSASKMTYSEYIKTADAKAHAQRISANQIKVLDSLRDKGLIMNVEHVYDSILDGAFVRTTYEQIADICNVEGVERITISNKYLPAVAVENPVDVYETGIFNSSDISFTGKGTIVAILDTGCGMSIIASGIKNSNYSTLTRK